MRRVVSFVAIVVAGCVQPVDQPGVGSVSVQPIEIKSASGVSMILLPGGAFWMGSDSGPEDEAPRHRVDLSPFAMDKYEVNQAELVELQIPNPSHFQSSDHPVEQLPWSDAAMICNARSEAEGLEPCYDETTLQCDFDASGYRLPTEAEWEYAARAGTDTDEPYDFGSTSQQLVRYACYAANSQKRTDPVGSKKSNPWGFCDLYGNVSEWCQDVYGADYYSKSPSKDPTGPREGSKRVLRGGSWNSSEAQCRVSCRMADAPGIADACFRRDTYGFRCVRRLSQAELDRLNPTGGSLEKVEALPGSNTAVIVDRGTSAPDQRQRP